MKEKCIALLGRRDEPTDAIEEYCQYLGEELRAYGFDLQIQRVPWFEQGWSAALRELEERAITWGGHWVLPQYTALAWSRRGFPHRFSNLMSILVEAGTRVGVVYHDVLPHQGQRLIDRVRRRLQTSTMQRALRTASLAVFTVPPEKLPWVKHIAGNAVFIPVGANLPISANFTRGELDVNKNELTVAVFGVTGGEAGRSEIATIAEATRSVAAQIKGLRLLVLGRNSESAEKQLRDGLKDAPVDIRVTGVLPGESVVRELSESDVLLCVRGCISTRRSSAIAGIACGLPVVAYAGIDTAAPITEAGLELYDPEKKGDLAAALVRVLKNSGHRATLADRSRIAQGRHFSWGAIAAGYAKALQKKA
jgi:glycosyltransferase involved in cell wall biosynthesis